MCHLSCYLTCVSILAVCLKTVAIAGGQNVSLKLKYNSSIVQNLTESQISSINITHICKSPSLNQDTDNKESNTHVIINCSVSRKYSAQSIPCSLSHSSQRCLPGVHLNHTSCPNIPVLFTNVTILYLDSKILSLRNCNDGGDGTWPVEVIIIASCSSVALIIMIIVSCIVVRRKWSMTKPNEIVAEVTTLNGYIQTVSKPADIAAEEIQTNNDNLRTPSQKLSEIINNMHLPDEVDMKKSVQDSSLAESGPKPLSEIQTSKCIDMRLRLSVETPIAAMSKEVDIDFLDECNDYSFIDNEGGDAVQSTAREPRSLPPKRSTIDSSTSGGTTRNEANDTRDVYSILGQEIRDFQNPYNETATERDCRNRLSSCTTKTFDLVKSEETEHPRMCDTGSNDVYSRLGEEIKEFENTYNVISAAATTSCNE